MEELDHVHAVGLLEQEDFADVFEHDFVIMGLAVELAQIRVEVKRVVATGDQHWQVLD